MCPIRKKKEKNQDFLIIENPDCLRPWARVRIQQSIARLVMDAFFCVVETCVNTVDEVVRLRRKWKMAAGRRHLN